MRVLRFFKKKKKYIESSRTISGQIYQSLDTLPIFLWFKINETNDYSLLIKSGLFTKEDTEKAWWDIMSEYVRDVGINENYASLIKAKIKLANAQIDYAITGRKVYLNWIYIYEEDIKSLQNNNPEKSKSNNHDLFVNVCRALKMHLDGNTLDTKTFFSYYKSVQEENDRYIALKLSRK